MILAEATWPDVQRFSRDAVVLIPTGAVEQHGPHLPLCTDALIVESIAREVERNLADQVVLVPTIWLGVSVSHLSFAGSLSASFDSYDASLGEVVRSLQIHGFTRFFLLNGHGGNSDSNRIALRKAKELNPGSRFAHCTYFELISDQIATTLQGPSKRMTHGDEAETSLVMRLRPDLVMTNLMKTDGLRFEPSVEGLVTRFDEVSRAGSVGYPQFATAETGARLFEAAIEAVGNEIRKMAGPLFVLGPEE